MAQFEISLNLTLANEGGYSNNLADIGGETYSGVSRKWNPSWQGWKVIDELHHEPGFPRTLENNVELQMMVKQFYRLNYWNPLWLDKINSQEVANKLFDIGVNMGTTDAALIAQRVANLMNKNQKLFPNLKTDGRIGPLSAALINQCTATSQLHKVFLKAVDIFQGWRYISLCEKDESQEEFFIGWMIRI